MFMEERQKDIIKKLNETGRILVSEIQEYYQISADCARRDLRVFYTIQMVKNIRINKAFLSHTALSLDFGASIHDPAGVEFGKAVMKNSSMNIGLYPSKKTGNHSIHSVCQITDYDLLITDSNVSEDFLMQVREIGVVIETVDMKGV